MSYEETVENAIKFAREEYPEEHAAKHAAFANSVGYLVHGCSGGFGGPSIREHAAGRLKAKQTYKYVEAIEILSRPDGVIFGEITDIHRFVYENENCFDDDPKDLEDLKKTK